MNKEKEIEIILQALVDEYVNNEGTDHEFIACITPEKRTDKTWLLWSRAIAALKRTI